MKQKIINSCGQTQTNSEFIFIYSQREKQKTPNLCSNTTSTDFFHELDASCFFYHFFAFFYAFFLLIVWSINILENSNRLLK